MGHVVSHQGLCSKPVRNKICTKMTSVVKNNDSVPMLTTSNYAVWVKRIKALLLKEDCLEFALGTETALPENATTKEKDQVRIRENRALANILLHVDEEIETLISDAKTPKEAWDKLKENFEPRSRGRQASLLAELSKVRYNSETGTMGTYISKLKNIVIIQLKETGYTHPDLTLTFDILRHLPSEYDGIVQSLYQLDDSNFTCEKIEKVLIAEEGRLRQKVIDQDATQVDNVMLVKDNNKKN